MTTRIACGQFSPAPGNAERNASLMADMAGEAASRGAALIVFPEMCLSGYLPAAEAKAAAVSAGGPEVARMLQAAQKTKTWILFGFPELRDGGRIANSMAFVDPEGRLSGIYRKVHLFTGEEAWAQAGDGFVTVNAGFARIGAWICFDARFPEAARTVAAAGARLGLCGAAWLGPAEEWELSARARALDNGMFVAGAALQGSYAGMTFHGASLIVDPHGRVVARAREGRDEVLVGDYDPAAVEAFQARLPLLSRLRPDAYRIGGGR